MVLAIYRYMVGMSGYSGVSRGTKGHMPWAQLWKTVEKGTDKKYKTKCEIIACHGRKLLFARGANYPLPGAPNYH